MKTPKRIPFVLALTVAFTLSVSAQNASNTQAEQDNTTCGAAITLTPDGSAQEGTFTAEFQNRWFAFKAFPDRSYAVMIDNLSSGNVDSFLLLDATLVRAGDCLTSAGFSNSITPENTEPASNTATNAGDADRLIIVTAPEQGGSGVEQVFFFALTAQSGVTVADYRVRVVETTLFNPRWSTFGGFSTQWGFHNTTNTNITGTLRVKRTGGVVAATDTFTIPAGEVVFKTSSSLGMFVNQAGNAIFVHNGPPGAIQADAFLVSSDLTNVVPAKFDTRSPQK